MVEDEPFIARYIGVVLSRDGYSVLQADNAETGWEIFRVERPRLRGVVTDIAMPGAWDGLELARRVREAAPDTPVLLVTGYPPADPLSVSNGLLRKPFTPDGLRAAVCRMLEPDPALAGVC